jgi:predicted GTPase
VFGTAAAQRKEYALAGGGTLHVIDLPGLGQSRATEEAYAEIYRRELPGVDVALYVLQADERLLGEDQRILRDVVLPALAPAGRRMPIVLGLNKVDLIGPGSWDAELNYPSAEQLTSIRRKSADIARKLAAFLPGISAGQIVHYSAERRFRLPDLLLAVIRAAGPAAWKLPANPASPWELASDEVQEYLRSRHGA